MKRETLMSEVQNDGIVELTESELGDVSGALPAVQKVREAAVRLSFAATDGDAVARLPE